MVQKCDSCGEVASVLLPLRVYEESKYGDESIKRWYCIPCWAIIIDAYKDEKEDEEDESQDQDEYKPDQITFSLLVPANVWFREDWKIVHPDEISINSTP